jgi:hypothetical protein
MHGQETTAGRRNRQRSLEDLETAPAPGEIIVRPDAKIAQLLTGRR